MIGPQGCVAPESFELQGAVSIGPSSVPLKMFRPQQKNAAWSEARVSWDASSQPLEM